MCHPVVKNVYAYSADIVHSQIIFALSSKLETELILVIQDEPEDLE